MSFSQDTKDFLRSLEIKNECCKKAYKCALDDYGERLKIKDSFRCDFCGNCFLRGLFIARGSVTNPESGYHLELSFKNEKQCDAVYLYLFDALGDRGLLPKKTERKSMYILYYKDSEAIEDFLAYIGANKAAFDIMNNKILKDIRNNTNKVVNCETANINRAVAASRKHIKAITELMAAGEFSKLLPELQRTGELRLEFEEVSLVELGLKMEPPISKSGVNHRLNKILEHYEKYLAEKQKQRGETSYE